MTLLKFLAAIVVPAAFGHLLLGVFPRSRGLFRPGESLAMSLGLGLGAVTQVMYFLSCLGMTYSTWLVTGILAVLIGTAIQTTRVRRAQSPGQRPAAYETPMAGQEKLGPFERSIPILILAFLGLLAVRTYLIEYDMWDSWAFWAYKAKIYFVEGRIPFEKFGDFLQSWGNWDYPHHLPLAETWVMLWQGEWNDHLPRLLFPLFFGALCLVWYDFLARTTNRSIALYGTLFLALFRAPQIFVMATLAEPLELFYYAASLLLLLRWIKEKEGALLLLSACFAGLAGWTKNEGLVYFLNNWLLLAFILWRKRENLTSSIKMLAIYAAIGLAWVLPWLAHKSLLELSNVVVNSQHLNLAQLTQHLPELPQVAAIILVFFLNFGYWNLAWLMFFLLFVVNTRANGKAPFSLLLLSIAINLAEVAFIYLMVPVDAFFNELLSRILLAPGLFALFYSVLVAAQKFCEIPVSDRSAPAAIKTR